MGFPRSASRAPRGQRAWRASTSRCSSIWPSGANTGGAAPRIRMSRLSWTCRVCLGSAGAVRVAHAVGARDMPRARRAGWTALLVGASAMIMLGLILFAFPVPLLSRFTQDAHVLDIGTRLLGIAAGFQLFDGTQAITTGVLRGIGDTRTPMLMNVIGHWVFGLPVGYALCFRFAWGVT